MSGAITEGGGGGAGVGVEVCGPGAGYLPSPTLCLGVNDTPALTFVKCGNESFKGSRL